MTDLIIIGVVIVVLTVLLVVCIGVLEYFSTYIPDRRKYRREERKFWKEVRNGVKEKERAQKLATGA